MKHDFLFMQSSMLTGCSYDDETRELTVTFSNSKNYVYEDVDKSLYDGLTGAESAGRYFNSIKAGLKVKK
jgi:hypothetical protein